MSTCDLSLEIPNWEEVHLVYGDQKAAQECHIATVKEVEHMEQGFGENTKIPKLEPEGEFELFVLDAQYLDRTVKIG